MDEETAGPNCARNVVDRSFRSVLVVPDLQHGRSLISFMALKFSYFLCSLFLYRERAESFKQRTGSETGHELTAWLRESLPGTIYGAEG